MKKLLAVLLVLLVGVVSARIGTSYSIPEVGIPAGFQFNLVSVDSSIDINAVYIPTGTAYNAKRAFNAFITVEDNDVRFSYYLLPSWRNMIKDTLNAATVVVDTSTYATGNYIKITATAHNLLDSMMVTFDSLENYTDTTNGYKVVFADSANFFIVKLPLSDTVIADSTSATEGFVRSMDHGHILPEGYIGYIFDNKHQIDASNWCSADSAKPSVVKFSIMVK